MLAARRKLQNGCPSCTAQILRFYVNSITELAPATAAPRHATHPAISRTRHHNRGNDARFLSTSSKRLQESSTEHQHKDQIPRPDELPDEIVQSRIENAAEEQPAEDEVEAADQLEGDEFDRILDEELGPEEYQQQVNNELLQDLPEDADPETIVRRAKRMFGNTLPPDYLSAEEYQLYQRLYGPPLRPTAPEDVGFGSFGEEQADASQRPAPKAMLFRQDADGIVEEIEYTAEKLRTVRINEGGDEVYVAEEEEPEIEARPPNEAQIEFIEANANNQREYEALLRLQQDFETARIKAIQHQRRLDKQRAQEEEEDIEEEEEEEEGEEDEDPEAEEMRSWFPDAQGARIHQYTVEGKFTTSPSTLHLPKADFVLPITELLKRTDTTHIRATAEKHFGGPGLPHSPATPAFARNLQQKGLGLEASFPKMTEIEADAFISTVLPGIYASATSALVEVRKRLGPEWIRGLLNRKDEDGAGPRVLDVGAGGAGLSAWQNILQTEWDMMREQDHELAAEPPGKRSVIVGSYHLRQRISRFLQNTQFLPRLPNYASIENSDKQLDAPEVPQKRKVYDVIIATHTLVPMEKEWRRRELLNQLWSLLSPEGGVLIVLEKGHPRGFEAVADVRQRLLDEFILAPTPRPRLETTQPELEQRIREPGMIVAPCTNHFKCPMYLTPGLSPGRKDFCHFSQRFIRPPFLQKVLGASHRNHEDINFSYVAIRRGTPPKNEEEEEDAGIDTPSDASAPSSSVFAKAARMLNDAQVNPFPQGDVATEAALKGYESVPADSFSRPHPLSLPRNILPPLKRKGHVTLDLCTPSGSIERWTVPKSFSKQAYHDARKARWGDLWALGAKTRVRRSIRLGRGVKEGERVPNDGGIRAARAAALNGYDYKGRKVSKKKQNVINLEASEAGTLAARTKGIQSKRPERRTKGGRLRPRERNLLKLDDLE